MKLLESFYRNMGMWFLIILLISLSIAVLAALPDILEVTHYSNLCKEGGWDYAQQIGDKHNCCKEIVYTQDLEWKKKLDCKGIYP